METGITKHSGTDSSDKGGAFQLVLLFSRSWPSDRIRSGYAEENSHLSLT